MPQKSLALYCESLLEECRTYTATLAHQLNIPIITQISDAFSYVLVITDQRLELRQINGRTKPICVDFLSSSHQYRCLKSNKKNELIAKAVGIKKTEKLSVIDATAGLGTDGFILAHLGCSVHWLERSGIIAALLQDGINRFVDHYSLHVSLTVIDAMTYLKNLTAEKFPDVIYLDPMFPKQNKSALVKKEMRLLRDIVGDDLDAPALLNLARQRAKKRVVVKRPRLAAVIGDEKPNVVYEGGSSRFDVYWVVSSRVSCCHPE